VVISRWVTGGFFYCRTGSLELWRRHEDFYEGAIRGGEG